MKRSALIGFVILAGVALVAPALHADVTTRRKTEFKFGGTLGGFINHFGGAATKNGVESSIAVKGNRMATIEDRTGQIIDLDQQKVYDLDLKKKAYTVTTFDQLRAQWQQQRAALKDQVAQTPPEQQPEAGQPSKQYEFDADVKDTGKHKKIAGYDTREVILTITAHEKGKALDEGGGFVMTNDMWMGPRIPALDEIVQFHMKFAKAIYGESFIADAKQTASMFAMYPSFKPMSEKMQAQRDKLQGTPLLTITTFDGVKSQEDMKAAQTEQSSGSGLGGMLARRLMRSRSKAGQRSTLLTTTTETQSVTPTATDADVAIPAGYTQVNK